RWPCSSTTIPRCASRPATLASPCSRPPGDVPSRPCSTHKNGSAKPSPYWPAPLPPVVRSRSAGWWSRQHPPAGVDVTTSLPNVIEPPPVRRRRALVRRAQRRVVQMTRHVDAVDMEQGGVDALAEVHRHRPIAVGGDLLDPTPE